MQQLKAQPDQHAQQQQAQQADQQTEQQHSNFHKPNIEGHTMTADCFWWRKKVMGGNAQRCFGCSSLGPVLAGTGMHGWRCVKCFAEAMANDDSCMCLACYEEYTLELPNNAPGRASRRQPEPPGEVEKLQQVIAVLEAKVEELSMRVTRQEQKWRDWQ